VAAEIFIGIDVARDSLEVAMRPAGDQWHVGNDISGMAELLARVRALRPTLIVLEATGGLELPLLGVLGGAGRPVVAVNPRQVRDFAKATGKLAKTDAIDAQVLAHFAEAVRPAVRPLPDAATQALSALVARRRQLVEMLTAEENRRASASAAIRADIQEQRRQGGGEGRVIALPQRFERLAARRQTSRPGIEHVAQLGGMLNIPWPLRALATSRGSSSKLQTRWVRMAPTVQAGLPVGRRRSSSVSPSRSVWKPACVEVRRSRIACRLLCCRSS